MLSAIHTYNVGMFSIILSTRTAWLCKNSADNWDENQCELFSKQLKLVAKFIEKPDLALMYHNIQILNLTYKRLVNTLQMKGKTDTTPETIHSASIQILEAKKHLDFIRSQLTHKVKFTPLLFEN